MAIAAKRSSDMPLSDLSVRAVNVLKRLRIETARDLARVSEDTLRQTWSCGRKTVREILALQFMEGDRAQGLTWYAEESRDGEWLWGHGGSDPGINSDIRLRLSIGAGVIVIMNTNGVRPREVTSRLLTEIEDPES